jgi:hypothetical protein
MGEHVVRRGEQRGEGLRAMRLDKPVEIIRV